MPSRLHRMRWKLVAGAAAIALSLGAAAALPTNLATASPPRTPSKATTTHAVTLITGDRVTVTTLGDLDAAVVDMRTLLIVGSSTTRVIANGAQPPRVYTPRRYPA